MNGGRNGASAVDAAGLKMAGSQGSAATRSPLQLTLLALSALLEYPDAEVRAAHDELAAALRDAAILSRGRLTELRALLRQFGSLDPYELEARYVATFDHGRRSTSLHLFEHVHGDSRDRGGALVDLQQTYERAGLRLNSGELPDHLTVLLQFAATLPDAQARAFVGETAHLLNPLCAALRARRSPYASVIAALLELLGQRPQPVPVPEEPDLDEAWAEPPAFGGCPTSGRSASGGEQPLQFIHHPRGPI